MKKHLLFFLALLVLGGESALAQEITGFGSAEFNPFDTSTGFEGSWTGTENATSLSITNDSTIGGGLYSSLELPVNIGINTGELTLTGSLTSSVPTQPDFVITLYDSSSNSLSYEFNFASFTSGTETITSSLESESGTFNGVVASWGLSTDGTPGDAQPDVSFTFDQLDAGAVPEPGIWTLLLMGWGALGIVSFRKLKVIRSFFGAAGD